MVKLFQYSLIMVFISILSTHAIAQESLSDTKRNQGTVRLSWEAEAPTYRVEIRLGGQVFINIETEKSEFYINLAPSEYEYRISSLNALKIVTSEGEWQTLNVQRKHIPYFRVNNPSFLSEGDSDIMLEIDASALAPKTTFQLIKDQEKIPVTGFREDSLILISLNQSMLTIGSWDLEAVDPSGMTFRFPDAITIFAAGSPVLESANQSKIPRRNNFVLRITGENFSQSMDVQLVGSSGEIPVTSVEVSNQNRAVVYLDTSQSAYEHYTLVLSNSLNEVRRIEKAIEVYNPQFINEKMRIPRFEFMIGFAPMLIFTLNRTNGSLQMDLTIPAIGIVETTFAVHSGWKKPFLRALGVEIRGAFGIAGPHDVYASQFKALGMLDIVAYWRPIVKGSFAPVIQAGFGIMLNEIETDLFNHLYIRNTLALDFIRYRNLFRFGVNSFFALTEFPSLSIGVFFRYGIRF